MIFIAYWLHIGVIVGPFWVHFRSILGYFWCLRVKNDHGLPRSEKSEAQERLSGAEGGPKWVQGRAKGARREPKGDPAGAILPYFFVMFSSLVFGWISE